MKKKYFDIYYKFVFFKYQNQLKFSNINKSHLLLLILKFDYRINIYHKQYFKILTKNFFLN